MKATKTHDSLGRIRRASQGGAGPKNIPDKKKAVKAGAFDKTEPSHLGIEGRQWWTWAVKTLASMGILDAADRQQIELCAETFEDYRHAQEDIASGGRILMDDHGNQKRHPAFSTMERARMMLRSFYSDLGLTPSARAKFGGGGEKEEDPFEKLQLLKRTG